MMNLSQVLREVAGRQSIEFPQSGGGEKDQVCDFSAGQENFENV